MTDTDRRSFLTRSAGALAGLSILPSDIFAFDFRSAGPRVAIIGAGRQGRAIMGELGKTEGVEIVALCDVDERRLQAGLRRTSNAQGFGSVVELLEGAGALDAVFIATPTHTHRQVAQACIAAGVNVYCEAPMEATIEDAAALARAARSSGAIFQVGLDARSNPVYQLARSFFRSDAVRDLVSVHAQHHRKTSWRTPASDPAREKALNWVLDPQVSLGLPGEWGTHQFDTVCWFTGRYPVSVRGTGSIRLHNDGRELADTIQCSLLFDRGEAMSYNATLANSYGGRFETLFGTNAAIKLAGTHAWMFKEADAPTQGWEVYANRQQFHNDEGITLIAGATKLAEQGKLQEGVGLPHPPLYYALGDFLKSVTEGAEVVCTADEGYRSTVVGICAARAVRTGEEVTIDDSLLSLG
ncbi:MAG: gfo/Idh/MocA family oxidoreductase [Planctomycetota bacterium]|nr:MAG: gfo/Idh/MocA family oxidoreductase [Planctomycetota bacterium]